MGSGIEYMIEIWDDQKYLVGQLIQALKTPTAFGTEAIDKLKTRLRSHGMDFHASLLDKDLEIDWPPPQTENNE